MYLITSLITLIYFIVAGIFLLPDSYIWLIFIILIMGESMVYWIFKRFFKQHLRLLDIESTISFVGSNIGALLMYLLVFNAYSPIPENLRWIMIICGSFIGQLIAKRLFRHRWQHHLHQK